MKKNKAAVWKTVLAGVCVIGMLGLTSCTLDSFDEPTHKKSNKNKEVTVEEVPGEDVTVSDAVNYEKKVIGYAFPDFEENQYTDYGVHTVKLPKITSETKNAEKFNEKLYNVFSKEYEDLLHDREEQYLFDCEYAYTIEDGIIGIVIECMRGAQAAGAECEYQAFYYDTLKDKELTFDKYLKALGLTKELLSEKVGETSEYKELCSFSSDESYLYLLDAIMDSSRSIVYFNDPDTMNGWSNLELKSFLK